MQNLGTWGMAAWHKWRLACLIPSGHHSGKWSKGPRSLERFGFVSIHARYPEFIPETAVITNAIITSKTHSYSILIPLCQYYVCIIPVSPNQKTSATSSIPLVVDSPAITRCWCENKPNASSNVGNLGTGGVVRWENPRTIYSIFSSSNFICSSPHSVFFMSHFQSVSFPIYGQLEIHPAEPAFMASSGFISLLGFRRWVGTIGTTPPFSLKLKGWPCVFEVSCIFGHQ